MQGTTPQPRRVGRAVAVAAALSLAVAGTSSAVTAQDDLDVLNVATTATLLTQDPVRSFSTEALYMANMYEPLLYATPEGAAEAFAPGLAKTSSTSEDGLTWTFELEEGVTFHDGEPFNSEAAKASIEAASLPASEGGRAGAWWIWPGIESIETPDETTLVVNLSSPAALDLVAASTYAAWMVSPAALEAADAFAVENPEGDYFAEAGQSFGTGPYMLEDYTPDSEVVLTQFPEYRGGWDDVDHYEKVVLSIIGDSAVQQQALDGGQVDLALRVPEESLDEYDANPDITVNRDRALFNFVGLLNTQRAPFDDPRVRQAIAYATPYQDIIDVAVRGDGTQSRAAVPVGVFPYDESVPVYETNIEKAKELLADAGVESFDMEIAYTAENTHEQAFAPLLQDAYSKIGGNVTLTPMAWPQQWDRGKGEPEARQDMFVVLYWPTYSDAGSDNLASLFRSGEDPFFNLSYWVNEEFDGLINEAIALTGTDRDAAQAKYTEAMNLLVEESPGIFFFDRMATIPVSNAVAGYEYNLNYPFSNFFYPMHPAE